MRLLVAVKAHQEPVAQLLTASYFAITSSHDHTLKVFDIRTMHSHVLIGHNAAIASMCVDEQTNVAHGRALSVFTKILVAVQLLR